MAETEMRKVSFTVCGDFITERAREILFVEKDLARALRILRSSLESDDLDPDEQLMLCLHVLHGSASIVGNTADGTYGIETRDDLDERPTDLSSIAKLISDMAAENKALKQENHSLYEKINCLAHEMGSLKLERVNADWYNATGEPMFPDMEVPAWRKAENQNTAMGKMLDSYMEQRKREAKAMAEGEEPECDYGWLEPDGTWHPVEWGAHQDWATKYLEEHPELDTRESIAVTAGDFLIYKLNWILLDSPWQGLAKVTRNESREMTKAQKEFLYDYFIKRNRHEEANRLYEE